MIHFLASSFTVYCHVTIHSVPSGPDLIHHLPSRSILKPTHCNTVSSFMSQSDYSTPIKLHSVLSSWNTFRSKPSQLNSSSPDMLQRKPLCCYPFSSFLYNLILCLPSRSIAYCHVPIHSVLNLTNWIHYLLSHFTACRFIAIDSTPWCTG